MSPPLIEVRRAGGRFVTTTDWVTSYSAFSFGPHYNPANVGFGRLLVHNDDVVRPGPGYDDHPHADAEIVTWVLSGSLVHQDSAGHRSVVHPGLTQRLSAGSGIVHAERNDAFRTDATRTPEPVHFVQMWVRPDQPGTPPSYRQGAFDLHDLDHDWLPIASGDRPDAVLDVASRGATLWATRLTATAVRRLPDAALLHVYVAAGTVTIETVGALASGDALRITGGAALRVSGDGELLVWAMSP